MNEINEHIDQSNFAMETISPSSYVKSKKLTHSFLTFFLGAVFSAVFFSDKIIDKNILSFLGKQIDLGMFLFILSIIIYVLYLFFDYVHIMYKTAQKASSVFKEKTEELKLTIEKINKKNTYDTGDELFNMAMALDIYEPVRFDLLEKAVYMYHHVYSGIYLGNLYHCGLYRNNNVIIGINYEKALNIYQSILDCDTTGIVAWKIGWMYERGQIDSNFNKADREKIALEYYKKSANLQYPKAFNSLGKFYEKGLGGLKADRFKAIENFSIAVAHNDTYAVLNKAYIHGQVRDEFDLAESCFKEAIKAGSPLAYLKYGNHIENNYDYYKNIYYPTNIIELYIKAATASTGSDSARAYVYLGNYIEKNSDTIDEKAKELLKKELHECNIENIPELCFDKAFKIFKNLIANEIVLSDTAKKVYSSLEEKLNPQK